MRRNYLRVRQSIRRAISLLRFVVHREHKKFMYEKSIIFHIGILGDIESIDETNSFLFIFVMYITSI